MKGVFVERARARRACMLTYNLETGCDLVNGSDCTMHSFTLRDSEEGDEEDGALRDHNRTRGSPVPRRGVRAPGSFVWSAASHCAARHLRARAGSQAWLWRSASAGSREAGGPAGCSGRLLPDPLFIGRTREVVGWWSGWVVSL